MPRLKIEKKVFGGVAVRETSLADIFVSRVNNGGVTGELGADAGIDRAFVGHKVRGAIDVRDDQRAKSFGVGIGNVERAGVTVTGNERHNRLHSGGLAERAVAGLAADIGFIGLDNFVSAANASGTSLIRMRVPATIGRPPQTAGSITTRALMRAFCWAYRQASTSSDRCPGR